MTSFYSTLFLTLATLSAGIHALSIAFPTSNDYWVSCKQNTLKWTYNSTDPDIFSVAIMHANRSLLNGNYQIANSLKTSNGTANISVNCLEASDGYYLLFVNASHYSLNKPQVYFETPKFSIKPKSTKVDDAESVQFGQIDAPKTDTTSSTSDTSEGSSHAANPNNENLDASKQAKQTKDGALNLQAASSGILAAIVALTVAISVTLF